MGTGGTYASFLTQRQQLLDQTNDPALKKHYQDEINLVKSWDSGDIGGGEGFHDNAEIDHVPGQSHPPSSSVPPVPSSAPAPSSAPVMSSVPETSSIPNTSTPPGSPGNYNSVPHGYADNWNTVRFSNTTNEPLTVHVTVAQGQPMPKGVDANGNFTIKPGQYVDITFDPGTSVNFKSTKGDGSVWNQGELFFDPKTKSVYGNMSYIYGANSNMRIFSSDGQHSGYLGDIVDEAPSGAKIGKWGVMAPYDRFHPSDDPNNPDSATGGPDGPKNAGADYLYKKLAKGEGYVDRGRPAEISDYDDASSLNFTGKVAVVF